METTSLLVEDVIILNPEVVEPINKEHKKEIGLSDELLEETSTQHVKSDDLVKKLDTLWEEAEEIVSDMTSKTNEHNIANEILESEQQENVRKKEVIEPIKETIIPNSGESR